MLNPFAWKGEVSRGQYALWGISLFGLKCTIDRIVVAYVFKQKWLPWSYVSLPPWIPEDVQSGDYAPLLTLAAIAMPFVWIGLTMTARRLRALGLSHCMLFLFFVPFVNFLLFAMLSILPDREHRDWVKSRGETGLLAQLIPRSEWGSAAFGILVTALLGLLLVGLSTFGLQTYGWGLFVGNPFMMGFLSAFFYSYHQPRTERECLSVAFASVVLLGCLLLAFAFEGVVCLLLASPLATLLAIAGGYVGYLIQRERETPLQATTFAVSLPILLAVLISSEGVLPKAPELYSATTFVDIAAPPETVWQNVVSFSEIPPPSNWLFKTGIAYPIRARIEGSGAGAVRYCEFSTGAFVEPIELWEEPRLLQFSVTHNPPPMAEWSPVKDIHPPHLDNFFQSERGQFRLIPLENGRTRLEGTTWYRHSIWPEMYWKMFSDFIVHRIHVRVLEHIKSLSEDQDGDRHRA